MNGDLMEIRLIGVPITVQQQSNEYYDGLTREFDLIRQSDTAPETVPVRLLTLIDEISNRFEQFSERPRTVLAAAVESGGSTVDLVYEIPREVVDAVQQLRQLLDEADAYCAAGRHLVTTTSPPLVRAYREWFLGEFVEQAEGRPPRPWPDAQGGTDGSDHATAAPAAESGRSQTSHDGADDRARGQSAQADNWQTTVDGDTATVTLAGEFDIVLAPPLRDHLNGLHAAGIRHFTVDTAGVSFIDSVALSVLLALYRRCREENGTVTLVRSSPALRRTLEISGLLEVLNVS